MIKQKHSLLGLIAALVLLCNMLVLPMPTHAAGDVVLYDGHLGGTPDTQGFYYLTNPFPPAAAQQTFANGVTTLNTSGARNDSAGYFARSTQLPALDRTSGFRVQLTVQLMAEAHDGSDRNNDGIDDRAGLSLIVLSSDLQGIELGFWPDRVWAQSDTPLFTQAESVSFDTTSNLTSYELSISQGTYTLLSAGQRLLSGPLRDYQAFGAPYTTPNFIFVGDDTSSASATFKLAAVRVLEGAGPTRIVYLPQVRAE